MTYVLPKKQQKLYALSACDQVVEMFIDAGGEVLELEPGCLGYGLTVCYGYGLKTAVITEVFVNTQMSAHKIRFYNEMPKKYAEMIDAKLNEECDEYWE